MFPTLAAERFSSRAYQFYQLTKPRVVSLIVFTAVIGMFLAVPGAVPLQLLLAGTAGIALVAGAAAAVNCLVEQKIDAIMLRTSRRPLPRGQLTSRSCQLYEPCRSTCSICSASCGARSRSNRFTCRKEAPMVFFSSDRASPAASPA